MIVIMIITNVTKLTCYAQKYVYLYNNNLLSLTVKCYEIASAKSQNIYMNIDFVGGMLFFFKGEGGGGGGRAPIPSGSALQGV